MCFSVVSHPSDAQVPIFTAQMKKASKKCQKNVVFFDFSNHARAQVPIFTPKMKNFGHGRRASGASGSTGNATRSVVHNPRNTRARGQDDGSSKQTPSKYSMTVPCCSFLQCAEICCLANPRTSFHHPIFVQHLPLMFNGGCELNR